MMKKFLVLILILSLAAVYPSIAFADDAEPEEIEEIENDDNEEPGKGTLKEWKIERNHLMSDRKILQEKFGNLGLEIEELEKELEAAEESEDREEIERLKAIIEELKSQMKDFKDDIMEIIQEMKSFMKERYSEEELKKLEDVGKGLKDKVDKILPVENILTEKEVKFDTPPVIKHGRTLIPVRAIAEGMGADVTYDADNNEVTITKDADTENEIIIVLNLKDNTVKVNKNNNIKEVEIDVPAEIMNNRTMVPLRFIAEQLGLKVQWNEDTETVAIEE